MAAISEGTTSSATLNSLPSWYEQYGQAVTGQGLNIMGGLQNYQGAVNPDGSPMQRVAGMDGAQSTAYNNVMGQQGQYQPMLGTAQNAAQGGLQTAQAGVGALGSASSFLNPAQNQFQAGGQTLNAGEVQGYMNPYIDNVVNKIATLGNRNLTENVLPQVNSTFTGAGQFGSTRNADFTNRALRDNQDSISGAQATALLQAQDSAFSNYALEKNRQLASGTGMGGLANAATNVANGYANNGQVQGAIGTSIGNLAQLGQNMNINDANALLTVGGLNQNTNQKGLDAAYQDFIDRRDYPTAQLGALSQLLPNVSGRLTPSTQTTQVSQAPTTDPLQHLSDIINQINLR